jgi:hypothetical protein
MYLLQLLVLQEQECLMLLVVAPAREMGQAAAWQGGLQALLLLVPPLLELMQAPAVRKELCYSALSRADAAWVLLLILQMPILPVQLLAQQQMQQMLQTLPLSGTALEPH